ncbi:MAG: hypothetical protein II117_00825 [Clostridia bacterium]|nr:hypothetical protein [Clostridia bacterium]
MKNRDYDRQTELLFETPAWVVDVFPLQVPAERLQQYLSAERWLRKTPRLEALYRRFAELLVVLGCYYDLWIYSPESDEWQAMPDPEDLTEMIASCTDRGDRVFLFPRQNALLSLNGGDLYLSLYDPDRRLLETVRAFAAAHGLFVREGRA